jgi:tetratricopeptide (TPR) repeat protein
VYYHEQGRDELVVPLWERAIAGTPDDDATAFGLAQSYDAVGARVSAIDYYKLARAYGRLEQYPDALLEYEWVLQVEPGNLAARDGLLRLRGRASGG